MGDVNLPKPEPGRVGAKVHELVESGHELYATAVTGHPSGRVRRPTLFVIAIASIAAGVFVPAALVVALIAILLLALTDSVVEL